MQLNILKNTSRNSGFTLMELMLVTIVIAIISGFALPNFSRAITKTRVRDAQAQLSAIYAANMIERATNGNFFNLNSTSIPTINTTLGINLVANGLTFAYNRPTLTTFVATAGTGGFRVRINEKPINPLAVSPNRNPCCLTGGTTCPSLGGC